jgi:hypothetical protein
VVRYSSWNRCGTSQKGWGWRRGEEQKEKGELGGRREGEKGSSGARGGGEEGRMGRMGGEDGGRGGGVIAGYRKTLALDNRTAYHGYFNFLRLETDFEQLSGGCTDSGGGAATKRNGLVFMRWTHIDLGEQDLNGIQRPKLFFKIAKSKVLDEYYNPS